VCEAERCACEGHDEYVNDPTNGAQKKIDNRAQFVKQHGQPSLMVHVSPAQLAQTVINTSSIHMMNIDPNNPDWQLVTGRPLWKSCGNSDRVPPVPVYAGDTLTMLVQLKDALGNMRWSDGADDVTVTVAGSSASPLQKSTWPLAAGRWPLTMCGHTQSTAGSTGATACAWNHSGNWRNNYLHFYMQWGQVGSYTITVQLKPQKQPDIYGNNYSPEAWPIFAPGYSGQSCEVTVVPGQADCVGGNLGRQPGVCNCKVQGAGDSQVHLDQAKKCISDDSCESQEVLVMSLSVIHFELLSYHLAMNSHSSGLSY
jgi:hypothetical protein